jgi:hypothetical protein
VRKHFRTSISRLPKEACIALCQGVGSTFEVVGRQGMALRADRLLAASSAVSDYQYSEMSKLQDRIKELDRSLQSLISKLNRISQAP